MSVLFRCHRHPRLLDLFLLSVTDSQHAGARQMHRAVSSYLNSPAIGNCHCWNIRSRKRLSSIDSSSEFKWETVYQGDVNHYGATDDNKTDSQDNLDAGCETISEFSDMAFKTLKENMPHSPASVLMKELIKSY